MGISSRAAIAGALLCRGWNAQTPSAVLLSASTVEARSWRGTLARLGTCELPDLYPDSPGLLVIGATVAIADQLDAVATALPVPGELRGGERDVVIARGH